jgi:hypothetical protein
MTAEAGEKALGRKYLVGVFQPSDQLCTSSHGQRKLIEEGKQGDNMTMDAGCCREKRM